MHKSLLFAALVPFMAVNAEVTLVSPKAGETVSQLWPKVKEFLDMKREDRKANRDRISDKDRRIYKRQRGAKPVEFSWKGDADGVYTLVVKRLPDGKEFYRSTVTGCTASVKGRLEIARKWEWTVSDGKDSAKGEFFTEDRGPRIISFDGVRNARDLGGYIGLDGRRLRQGLFLRTGGLNNNAKSVYYTYEEILELHKQGKLEDAGVGKSAGLGRQYASSLGRGNGIDRNFLRLIKSGPTKPGTERLSAADRDYLLNFLKVKSDIDFREDWETFGMLFSPLGKRVTWYHYPMYAGYWGFTFPSGRATQALAFSVLIKQSNYPVVAHCIGGTDRTGTFSYLIGALLGMSEEDLIRDYEMSFIGAGGVDKRHYSWLEKLVTAVRGLPGETLADKVAGYYLSLGFTPEDIETVRGIMLEKKQ